MSKELTHIDENDLPGMVDVTHKSDTERIAIASGSILIPEEYMEQFRAGDFTTKKGSIIQTAIIAGTMAVKKTYEVIPFCHQIPISSCRIEIEAKADRFEISCRVKTYGKTGVEMEALQGVSTAALAIYDMCKALTHEMTITDVQLLSKSGGKSDYVK